MDTVMSDTAKLDLNGQTIELPITVGSENEHAFDISRLRSETGYITLDSGYGNTGSCESAITFIDGEKGILRYRGIPIEQLGKSSTFIESSMLLMNGELPTKAQLAKYNGLLAEHAMLHEGMRSMFDGFGANAHPMAILSAMINAISCYHPDIVENDGDADFESASARLLSKVRTIAAASYKVSIGEPIVYPNPKLGYVENFLHMMFSKPYQDFDLDPDVVAAMELFFILHADHEQNCSTSTVRMVGSSGANLFASCAAGVCALWGPLHGGANVAVLKQLEYIHKNNIDLKEFIVKVKDKDSSERLMGFGHRVYKNFDPRANIFKSIADKVLKKLHVKDPLLDIARHLEEVALADSYFKDRNLYPNVDFYSGIILRAIGIPTDMFTVMFAIGRMPGWMSHWKELRDSGGRIHRPRQIYTGATERDYVAIDKRG
jgi:citrate synthase